MPPQRAGGQLLVNWQAFVDDSAKSDGAFCLAGYVAPAEAWANFAKEWKELLPYGTRDSSGESHFKMHEMMALSERQKRIQAFYNIIEKHVTFGISNVFRISDFHDARASIHTPRHRLDWGKMREPYYYCFATLMNGFHHSLSEFMPEGGQIDFIFDDQSEKKHVLDAWDAHVEQQPSEIRKRYGVTPRFESDRKFVPLQAADFWAWSVRRNFETGEPLQNLIKINRVGGIPSIFWEHDRARIVKNLQEFAHQALPPGAPVYSLSAKLV
jgi:hypothetical protein